MSANEDFETLKKRLLDMTEQVFKCQEPGETNKIYKDWAEIYDQNLHVLDYTGPDLAIDAFLKLGLPKDTRILDIGAGTGILGQLLQKNGYTNLDALDASEDMLKVARSKNVYKNLLCSLVAQDIRLPIDDNTYDAVVAVGCLCPGHIRWNSFPQIIRVVKKGGIIFWVVANSKAYEDKHDDFKDGHNERLVESLCEQGKWKHMPGYPKTVENYLFGGAGLVYAMQVL